MYGVQERRGVRGDVGVQGEAGVYGVQGRRSVGGARVYGGVRVWVCRGVGVTMRRHEAFAQSSKFSMRIAALSARRGHGMLWPPTDFQVRHRFM